MAQAPPSGQYSHVVLVRTRHPNAVLSVAAVQLQWVLAAMPSATSSCCIVCLMVNMGRPPIAMSQACSLWLTVLTLILTLKVPSAHRDEPGVRPDDAAAGDRHQPAEQGGAVRGAAGQGIQVARVQLGHRGKRSNRRAPSTHQPLRQVRQRGGAAQACEPGDRLAWVCTAVSRLMQQNI